eukprot:TRINITY_DN9182_c0_g3_i12.p1 TRINITY_DN9182_c0_g3~~TRINITY_DN9182_c0_g3_i12.p1  ORF type:complete len:152 (+),score=5.80 TRINITY_DN9182_c0_g3_i12:252-707(+)
MSSKNLDKSLEEIISERKQKKGGGAVRKPRAGRRIQRRPFNKPSDRPFDRPRIRRRGQPAPRRPVRESYQRRTRPVTRPGAKTRLVVDGLGPETGNKDLNVLFADIGPLKRCGIRWDKLGKSTGKAFVEYESPEDARKAIAEYNGEVWECG